MTPEEYEKLYGYAPSQELQEAWASGPQAVQSYKDKPVAEAIHAIVEPFTTRGVGGDPDDAEFASGIGGMNRGLASLLNPAVMVSGAANVVDNWANPAAENSLMDYIWGGPNLWPKHIAPTCLTFWNTLAIVGLLRLRAQP